MIRHGLPTVTVVAAIALLLGCSGPMDPAKVSKIVPGQTTVTEARRILGKPDSQLGSQGRILVRYFTAHQTGRDGIGRQSVYAASSLDLLSDTNGIIQKIHRYDSASHLQVRHGSARITGPDLSEDSLKRIHTGKTTTAQMGEMFGAPSEELLGFAGTMLRRWVEIKRDNISVTAVIVFLETEFDEHDVVSSFSTEQQLILH
jgi:hypothetical protein